MCSYQAMLQESQAACPTRFDEVCGLQSELQHSFDLAML